MAMLSKGRKPDKFESLNLSFANIRGPLKSNSPDIPALCETNLGDAIDSDNFSVKGYLSLIRKDSLMHGPAVYVKEGVSFSRDLYPEKLRILMILTGFISFTVLLRFPISIFLDAISFNIDEVLSINIMALLRRLAFLVGLLTFSVSLSLCLCHCLSWSYFINSFLLTLVFLFFFTSIGKF